MGCHEGASPLADGFSVTGAPAGDARRVGRTVRSGFTPFISEATWAVKREHVEGTDHDAGFAR